MRIAKLLTAASLAASLLGGSALAHGGHGGWGGGWGGGGWHGGGWGGGWGGWYGGWGGGWPYYGYGYWPGYDYDYGYPPPAPSLSPYCVTTRHVCVLRTPRGIGSACTCRGARGEIGPPP